MIEVAEARFCSEKIFRSGRGGALQLENYPMSTEMPFTFKKTGFLLSLVHTNGITRLNRIVCFQFFSGGVEG